MGSIGVPNFNPKAIIFKNFLSFYKELGSFFIDIALAELIDSLSSEVVFAGITQLNYKVRI